MQGALGTPHDRDLTLPDGISRAFLLHHRLCPLSLADPGTVVVATCGGTDPQAVHDLGIAFRRRVVRESLSEEQIPWLVERLVTRSTSGAMDAVDRDRQPTSDLRDLANRAPVVRYVNLLLGDAVRLGASDVHLDGSPEGLAVRFRIDGSMCPGLPVPAGLDRAIVSRIKVLADLDIAERRTPQDGSFRVRLDDSREIDLRVSTSPTVFGESVVLRILERGRGQVSLGELGLPPALHDTVHRIAAQPHGMLLATGPTGSGKTTSLYAALGLRDAASEKIITIEDPVEYSLAGVSQIPVGSTSGVTFPRALRSVLRQDPDVIMVGEIRDGETAQLAVQAALTGHLVLSSLHTTDAPGAVARMLDLGVPSFLLAATLSGVLAQRLVRRICPSCRSEDRADPRHLDLLRAAAPNMRDEVSAGLWRGAGCDGCRGTGYRGRVGIFEFLEVTDDVRKTLTSDPTPTGIRRVSGVAGLAADGVQKARDGITSIEEVVRAIQ